MEVERVFTKTLELNAKESFRGDDVLLEKLNLLVNFCFDDSIVLKIKSIIKKGPRVCSESSSDGVTTISIKFLADCFVVQENDIIMVKINDIKYNKFLCSAPYISAVAEVAGNYKKDDKILMIVSSSTYYGSAACINGQVFDQYSHPTMVIQIYDTKEVPPEAMAAIEKARDLILNELKNSSKSYQKTKSMFYKTKKYKVRSCSALKPVFEEDEKLLLVLPVDADIDTVEYFLVPAGSNLKDFSDRRELISGEPHYAWVIRILNLRYKLIRALNQYDSL